MNDQRGHSLEQALTLMPLIIAIRYQFQRGRLTWPGIIKVFAALFVVGGIEVLLGVI